MAARTPTHWVVPALFALAAAATALGATHPVYHALGHPGTRTVLEAIYAILRTLIAVAFVLLTVGRAPARRRARSPFAFVVCALAMSMTVALRPPLHGTPEAFEVMGESIAVAACALMALSLVSLGRCFSVLPEARGLVTSGAYGMVRHPLYVAEIAAFSGLTIAAPELANAFLLGILIATQYVRMRFEERALTEAFPEYERYARTVPALIPSPRALLSAAWPRVPARRAPEVAGEPARR
jgi:protein-S-isoprenylcysteine O-methyltransferase Ste14